MGILNQLWHFFTQTPASPPASISPVAKIDSVQIDPFTTPVILEITDVIDLHAFQPREVKAVVEEYLFQARSKSFKYVRIIHGKGIGVQREMVRSILSRCEFVISFHDAPPQAGGLGATIAELSTDSE